ncbi:unnamed protein product [Gadus morhua 'NCC']
MVGRMGHTCSPICPRRRREARWEPCNGCQTHATCPNPLFTNGCAPRLRGPLGAEVTPTFQDRPHPTYLRSGHPAWFDTSEIGELDKKADRFNGREGFVLKRSSLEEVPEHVDYCDGGL